MYFAFLMGNNFANIAFRIPSCTVLTGYASIRHAIPKRRIDIYFCAFSTNIRNEKFWAFFNAYIPINEHRATSFSARVSFFVIIFAFTSY